MVKQVGWWLHLLLHLEVSNDSGEHDGYKNDDGDDDVDDNDVGDESLALNAHVALSVVVVVFILQVLYSFASAVFCLEP